MKPKMLEAVAAAKENARTAERLKFRFELLQERTERCDRDYSRAVERHFDQCLVPFADAFARLKNVELDDPDLLDRVPRLSGLRIGSQKVEVGAVKGLVTLAGGAGVGAGAGALTFAAVGTFAAASTGTAISTLSGAAATSATLAWLGGGSLATGGLGVAGGTMVLTGLVAAPVILAGGAFLSYRGRKELARQQQDALRLTAEGRKLRDGEQRLSLVEKQVRDAELTMEAIAAPMSAEVQWLRHRVDIGDDYTRFRSDEKDRLAALVALAVTMSTVMRTELISKDGKPNPEHHQAMLEARNGAAMIGAPA